MLSPSLTLIKPSLFLSLLWHWKTFVNLLNKNRFKNRYSPWFSPQFSNYIHNGDKAWSKASSSGTPEDWVNLKQQRNICISMIRNTKSNYYQSALSVCDSSTKFWNPLTSLKNNHGHIFYYKSNKYLIIFLIDHPGLKLLSLFPFLWSFI